MRNLPLVAAFAIVVAYGTTHGVWTDRWTVSPALNEAADRLPSVSLELGDWVGHAVELGEDNLALGETAGFLTRSYVHRQTGERLSVFLNCGRPGPVAVHTPDVCYEGAGYRMVGGQGRYAAPAGAGEVSNEFWVAKFRKEEAAVPEQMRIYWAWSAAGPWRAPDNPRVAFARVPVLYKLYVIRRLPTSGAERPPEEDSAVEFLQALTAEIGRRLFSDP